MTLVFEDFALLFVSVMHVASVFISIPVFVNVIVTATTILYVGSLRSVITLLDEDPNGGANKLNGEKTPGNRQSKREESVTLSSGDAWRFPLVGSAFLLSAYCLLKLFGRDALNALLTLYFAAFGAFAIEGALESEVGRWVFDIAGDKGERRKFGPPVLTLRPEGLASRAVGTDKVDVRLTRPQLACWTVALIVIVWYSITKHFLLNNAIAACLALSACEMISVGSFRNAAILLTGLFVYDVTWVFGSDVMVTVAKGIDGPIKLLFVRGKTADTNKLEFSMLGLGDIVVPGLLVAMLLRFDVRRFQEHQRRVIIEQQQATLTNNGSSPQQQHQRRRTPWPYFRAGLVAYAAGLAATLFVMYAFDAAQPALLYLVPSCLGASLLVAGIRGELGALTAYAEDEDEEEEARDDGASSTTTTSGARKTNYGGAADETDKLLDRTATTTHNGTSASSSTTGGYLGVQDDRKQD